MNARHIASLFAVPVALMLGMSLMTPVASAASSPAPTSSSRSFPASRPHRDLTRESVSTDVTADWGGIESLDVPRTKSQAEKDAESRAVSRSAARTATPAAPSSTSVDPGTITGEGSDIARYALQYQGIPYVYGGTSTSGWDCSGFTMFVYARFGISLPHQSEAQKALGTPVAAADARPGDLMWRYGHVGVYVGDGLMVHASTPSTGTIVTPASYGGPYAYYRLSTK